MIRNALQGLINEWNATDQPLQQRGGVLPLGIYEDGSVHLAWPGMITDTIDAFERAGQGPGMQNPEDAFVIGGSLGVGGLAAPRPANALASNSARISRRPFEVTAPAVNALADDAPRGITAYHGSPHDFDRFSLDKIGTGEGAQAYGHGLYFAENEGVAKNYRKNLGYKDIVKQFRDRLPDDADAEELIDLAQSGALPPKMSRVINALAADDWLGFDYPSQAISAAFRDKLQNWDPSPELVDAVKSYGNMYKVRINAEPDQFLDLDAPVSAIPETHRQALEQIGSYPKTLEHTKALREAGIPGIRYLDGMSRGAGQGSSNYVVFDENLIDILEKYANPWTSAPLGLAPNAFEDPRQALINRLAEVY